MLSSIMLFGSWFVKARRWCLTKSIHNIGELFSVWWWKQLTNVMDTFSETPVALDVSSPRSPVSSPRSPVSSPRSPVSCPQFLVSSPRSPVSSILNLKGAYSSSWNSPQNYGTPLVNGITQCYLPPDRGDRPAFTPTAATWQVGTRFIDPVRMKGWVGLVGWLHIEMVYPSTDGHPSEY